MNAFELLLRVSLLVIGLLGVWSGFSKKQQATMWRKYVIFCNQRGRTALSERRYKIVYCVLTCVLGALLAFAGLSGMIVYLFGSTPS